MSDLRQPLDVILRPPLEAELPAASALCLRSKAHWGYEPEFIEACRQELTLTPSDLAESDVKLALSGEKIVGVAQLSHDGSEAELDKLFVEPGWFGLGIGRLLCDWSFARAQEIGAHSVRVTADPDALPFYETMGFERVGKEPSGSIAGRVLPVLRLQL